MPPSDCSSEDKDAFLISALDPQALNNPEGVDCAFRTIETMCHQGDPEVARVVAVLISRPYLLEYIFSGTSSPLIRPCVLQVIMVFLSSIGEEGVRGTPEVGIGRVPHIRNVKCGRYHEPSYSPEVITFVAICRVSICLRCASQPPRVPEKGQPFV